MLEPLVDTKVAAEYLGFHFNTLEQWRLKGIGPRWRKIGRNVKYAPADLMAFAEEGIRTSTSEAA